MFAIVDFKGNQLKVVEGKEVILPLFECKKGDKVVLDKVVALSNDDKIKTGATDLKDVSVEAKVIAISQTKKIGVVKFHSKKRYKKVGGHRQDYVKVLVSKIIAK